MADMSNALGLSIGATNLAVAPPDRAPITRRAVLTVFRHRPPEVGTPAENPRLTERGLVITDFVERVGDPVPILAADGSSFSPERLVADAVAAVANEAGTQRSSSNLTIAAPSHWTPTMMTALDRALRQHHGLHGGGLRLVPDSVAALTALQANPGLPARGIIVLCDFGGSGTSITLANAADGYRSVGPTVRFDDLSGDLLDQTVLTSVLADVSGASGLDSSSTSAVGALTALRERSRLAKERLSHDTATAITSPLPTLRTELRFTRSEFEAALRGPLEAFLSFLREYLQHSDVRAADLVTVASVGGGASIPLITQRLSETLRLPVVTTARPHLLAAVGAVTIARRGPEDDVRTKMGTAAAVPAPAAATGSWPTSEPQLAWSDVAEGPETGDGYGNAYGGVYRTSDETARPAVQFGPDWDDTGVASDGEVEAPLPIHRRPGVLFGAAALLVAAAATGFILTSQTGLLDPAPVGSTAPTTAASPPIPTAAPPPAPSTPAAVPTVEPRETVVVRQTTARRPAPSRAPVTQTRAVQPAPSQAPPEPTSSAVKPAETPPEESSATKSSPEMPVPKDTVPDPEPGTDDTAGTGTGTGTGGTGTGTGTGGTGTGTGGTGTGTGGTGTTGTGTGTGTGGTGTGTGGTGTGGTGTGGTGTGTGGTGTGTGTGGTDTGGGNLPPCALFGPLC